MDHWKYQYRFPVLRSRQTTVLGEEVVAGAVAAEIVPGGVFGCQEHAIQLFVDRDRPPVAGIAGVRPGIVLPCVVAGLAGLGNRVEDPQALARPHVVASNVALDVLLRARGAAGQVGRPDDDTLLPIMGGELMPMSAVSRLIVG